MFRIDNVTAAPALPAPAAAGTPGYFTNGDAVTNTPRTIVDQDWFNMVQEELISILAAAGIAPDKANRGQVLAAILALIGAAQPVRSWQDVTSSRISGTVYTNTLEHEIEVVVVWPDTNGNTAYATVTVDGVNIVNHTEIDHDTSTSSFSATFTVPAGSTYSATASGGTIGSWCELR